MLLFLIPALSQAKIKRVPTLVVLSPGLIPCPPIVHPSPGRFQLCGVLPAFFSPSITSDCCASRCALEALNMDTAYNQHSPYSRHRSLGSSTNLNHLTLAPLSQLKLPINDYDFENPHDDARRASSYIEGRSAPTTPSILSRSSSRVTLRKPKLDLPKSKSSTHLRPRPSQSGTTTPGRMTPGRSKLRQGITRDDLSISAVTAKDGSDSDWLLRASAMLTSSAQESKGQSWLATRQSSTSLSIMRDEEDEEEEIERRASQQASRKGSRRGSLTYFDADDELSPFHTRRSSEFEHAGAFTPIGRRAHSRRNSSRPTTRAGPEEEQEGYFYQNHTIDDSAFEPDFVDVEEDGYEDFERARRDEAVVRKLARASSLGLGGWIEKMLGWSLFAIEEDGDETEIDTVDGKTEGSGVLTRTSSRRNLDASAEVPPEERMPPLNPNEAGAWNDAAWLLSVASKVLL